MSEYEVRVSTNVDTSELDAAQKKLDNLVKNDKQIKVDFNIDGMKNLNKINGAFKNIEKSFGSAGKIAGQNFNKGFENAQNKSASNKLSGIDKELEKLKKGLSTFKYDSASAKMESQLNKYAKQSGNKMLEEARAAKKIYDDSLKSIKELSSKGKLNFNDVNVQNTFSDLTRSSEKFKNAMSAVNSELSKTISVSDAHSAANKTLSWLQANTKAADKYGDQLEELANKQRNALTAGDLKEYTSQVRAIQSAASAEGLTGMSKIAELKRAVTQIGEFVGIYGVLQNVVMDGSKMMVKSVMDVDKAMIELTKVSNAPQSELASYFDEAADSAKKYGATISDVIQSTADWSRLGYSLKDAKQLSETTTLLEKIGDNMTQESSSEGLISTLKGFNLQADEAMSVVDKVNEIANTQPIDTAGIFEGLKRSASSMSAANNTLSETIGLITAANSVVQDPTSVGTAFKTISMRIRGAKTELEEAGLETDGMAESTASLREELMALSGVDIMENDTTFKSTYKILDELSNKWKDLTDIQQASVTELIAGKRQGNVISALMQNFDIARQSVQTAEFGSEGSAQRELDNWNKGIEASISHFKAQFQEFSTSMIDSDLFKGIVDGGTAALDVVTQLVDTIGLLPTILGGLGIGAFIKNLD